MLGHLHRAAGIALLLVACKPPEATSDSAVTATSAPPVEVATRVSAASPSARPTTASRGAPAQPSASADDDKPPARPPRVGACTDDGLLAKGTVRTAGIDLHSYARVLGDAFKKDVLIAGDLASPKDKPPCVEWCLDFEDTAKDFEQAFKLTGAPLTMRRGAALISYRTQPDAAAVLAPSPAVDLNLTRVGSADLTRLLGDVSKRKIAGVPEGALSVFVRGRPALDTLALLADAAGTTLVAKGNEISFAGGNLPGGRAPESTLTPPAPGNVQRDVLAAMEDVSAMKLVALVNSPSGDVRAALRSPNGSLVWVVRVGDFIGKPRIVKVDQNEVASNARVERIHCLGIEFVYDDKSRAWLFLK